jgi:hypothetical protein
MHFSRIVVGYVALKLFSLAADFLVMPCKPLLNFVAVYCTVLLFSACITEKELLNAGVPLSTQGPYLAPGLEDLLVDLYVITALGFGD